MGYDRDLRWRAIMVSATGGAALLGAGLAKIAAHLGTALVANGSLCGFSADAGGAAAFLAHSAHCWGCPLAFAGALSLAGAIGLAVTAPRHPDGIVSAV